MRTVPVKVTKEGYKYIVVAAIAVGDGAKVFCNSWAFPGIDSGETPMYRKASVDVYTASGDVTMGTVRIDIYTFPAFGTIMSSVSKFYFAWAFGFRTGRGWRVVVRYVEPSFHETAWCPENTYHECSCYSVVIERDGRVVRLHARFVGCDAVVEAS